MATRLYLHDANSGVSGTLPSDEQSSLTPTASTNFSPFTTNKSMDTNVGTSQVTLERTDIWNSVTRTSYISRWVSPPLGVTQIDSNTWTYNFATRITNLNGNWPVTNANQPIHVNLYVWRPSNGTKIGTILDGNTASTVDEHSSTNTERNHVTTFSGSQVTCQTGDVLIFEAWVVHTSGQAVSMTRSYYYDGTTVNTTENSTVSNHASFIETPQDNLFTAPTIDATSDYKDILKQRPQILITNSI